MLNLQLSLALCLVVLGMWLEWLEQPQTRRWWQLLLLTTVLYFTHLVGFAVAGWVMTAYALVARRGLRDLALSWILFLPGAFFFLHSTMPHAEAGWAPAYLMSAKWTGLLVFATSGLSTMSDFLSSLVVVAALAIVCLGNPDWKSAYRWLGVVGSLFALYWVLPAGLGPGMNADRRLIPFIFVLGLAALKPGRYKQLVGVLAISVFVLRVGGLEYYSLSAQKETARLTRAFSAIPAGTRVLPVSTGSEPMQHFWAYGVIQRGWLSPCLFQNRGVQPLRTVTENDSLCGSILHPDGPFQWQGVRGHYDYVWVYGVPKARPTLAAIGQVVYGDGELQVFQIDQPLSAQK
jgi:hypothetical protein